MVAHLSIGTSDNRISLLNSSGFLLSDWPVGGTEYGTIFQESKLADFRQMAGYRDLTVIETFNLKLRASSQDAVAGHIQDLREIVRLALDYWSTTYQYQVVYLAAQASCETNMRYAVVYDVRLVGESNPFGQPFLQSAGGAVMDSLSLIVERGPWLENEPGTGTCVAIRSSGPATAPYILHFDGVDDVVDCGSGASLDNLPSANFTAEAWIRAESWGELGITDISGIIFSKYGIAGGPSPAGWVLMVGDVSGFTAETNSGVIAFAEPDTFGAITWTGMDDFFPDSQWHHIATVWTQASLRFDIAIDGIWVSTTVEAGVGVYATDASEPLCIGANSGGGQTFDGHIGWSRISDIHRYTVGINFTPPDRCTCPASDGDTVALWCLEEGVGATIYDETANNNDGTITGATWVWSGCEKEYIAATCNAQSVFVANKHNTAQLTHAYYWDESGGAWNAANLIGTATPFAFLPAVPSANDFVIFGVSTTLVDTGPFSSLILDIGTIIGAGGTLQWRYKGAGGTDDPSTWTTLVVQDNTNMDGAGTGTPFDTLGIGSVHWEKPADWATSNPDPGVALGVTGYWVACYVTVAAASPPQQANRDFYTVTWPYIEFSADEIGGDMPALLRLSVDSRSAYDGISTTTDLWCQRVLVGLRSYDRGETFTSYINISDEQNDPSITITAAGGTSTIVDLVTAPTGRCGRYIPAAAGAYAYRFYIRLTPDFYGRFHAFIRGQQAAGVVGCANVRLAYSPSASAWPAEKYTISRQFVSAADDQLLDFGEIVLGPYADTYPLEISHTYIMIEANCTDAGGATVYFYDLILIPVDEWAVDAEDMAKSTGSLGYTNDYWSHLEIDGIRNQRTLLSYLLGTVSGKIARYWRPITNGLPILQTGKKQRLWFLCARNDDYADVDDVRANSEICSSIQIWKQQRYSTLRGDR